MHITSKLLINPFKNGVYILVEVSFYIWTTWWVSVTVDQWVPVDTCSQVLQWTSGDSHRFKFSVFKIEWNCYLFPICYSFRKFYGRYGDLVEQYGVTLSGMLDDILTLDQQWIPYRSDFPPIYDLYTELDLHRIMSGFHGAFALGVASQQGTLTLPDTWFRPPFWDLLMLQLLRPNSSNLPCLYSTFHLEYPWYFLDFALLVYYTIPFGFSLFRQFWASLLNFFNYFVWLRITEEGSVPEMRITSKLLINPFKNGVYIFFLNYLVSVTAGGPMSLRGYM